MHYFYGHYYAAQAMWTAGGDYWAEWYPPIRDELLTGPPPAGRLLVRPDLHALRHRHGLHHPADPQQLPADLAEMNGAGMRSGVFACLLSLLPVPALAQGAEAPLFVLHTRQGTNATGPLQSLDDNWSVRLGGAKGGRADGADVISLRRRANRCRRRRWKSRLLFGNGDRVPGTVLKLVGERFHFRPDIGPRGNDRRALGRFRHLARGPGRHGQRRRPLPAPPDRAADARPDPAPQW